MLVKFEPSEEAWEQPRSPLEEEDTVVLVREPSSAAIPPFLSCPGSGRARWGWATHAKPCRLALGGVSREEAHPRALFGLARPLFWKLWLGRPHRGLAVLCHFSSTPAPGVSSPGKDRTRDPGAYGGLPTQHSVSGLFLLSFLSNHLGWTVNEACLSSQEQSSLLPVSGIRASHRDGFGATGLLFLWVVAETLSEQMSSLSRESLCCDRLGFPS